MTNEEWVAQQMGAYSITGYAALAGFLQGLHDKVQVTTRPGDLAGVTVYGDGGLARFYGDNQVYWLETVDFSSKGAETDCIHVMPCGAALASNLMANLTLQEITDYIDRFNDGKNPDLTDYVDEVI